MKKQNLSKLELQVMRPFWTQGELTVREAAEALAQEENDPGYSTVQTIVGRLEAKGALTKTKKVGNAWLFKAAVERKRIVNRMIDELVTLLDGASSPILSHLVESKKISKAELDEIRKLIDAKGSSHE
ncbi:MAG: BlaI/MecI/CopY family transcriptional regulator [Verrucomicrobia bacterium]|nr:BlaI/MecI/CopY family transcriptional regulator [Verrucomicrobiota bacterium]MDA1069528.1 BlaI/MecI/CopY family transcriptional regulator [Verrucomicrobiota bacterium]